VTEDLADLPRRLRAELLKSGRSGPGDVLILALSGGLDSVVLLHLLRFGAEASGMELRAAHFDHGMRRESRDDSLWVAGLCRAWAVPLDLGRASPPPASENEARRERYEFLEARRAEHRAAWVLTAHHADDQAETVLFRLLRGTGRAGLAGIASRREPGIWRPLLGFWRDDLEAYASAYRLSWREDATNGSLRYARNVLRRRVLPEIERLVAPGARRALVRLADLSREDEAAWRSVLPSLLAPLDVRREGDGVSFEREALLQLHPAVRPRVLRAVAADLGATLDAATTRGAVDFASAARSGQTLHLGRAWSLRRDFDRLVIRRGRGPAAEDDRPLLIPDEAPGSGTALMGGEAVAVSWGRSRLSNARFAETFDPARLRFPLTIRARRPGDRIRLLHGTTKVKKLLGERRVPRALRDRVPLLVDSRGEVLWIPQLARTSPAHSGDERGGFRIFIT